MYPSSIHTALASVTSRARVVTALGAAALTLVAAVPAFAADNAPNGPASQPGKCPVEDQNGNVSYVDAGTRVGLFYCGKDGEWHFGTVVNARVAPSSSPTLSRATVAGRTR